MDTSKILAYVRISTTRQCEDRQILAMNEKGVKEEDIYIDKMTGTKMSRPKLDELRRVVRNGDTVIIESMSRLSRSSKDLLTILEEFNNKGVKCISLKENIDFSTATGKMMIGLMAVLSEFEASCLKERVLEGLEAARKRGRNGGRPRTEQGKLNKAVKLYDAKTHSIREIVEITGVSQSVLYRELRKRKGDK